MSFGRVVAVALFAIGMVGAGCTKANPLDCSDGTCSDPAHPYCDKDGTVDGAPNTCIKPACSTPNEFVECKGDTAVSCNATEDGYTIMQCAMGCSDTAHGCNMCTPNGTYCTAQGVQSCGSDGAPTAFEACAQGCVADPQPHCAHLVPRYLPNICDTAATDDVTLPSATLGTDLDSACTGGVVQQTAAPDICIVRGKTIAIASGATLKATGARLLALVADDSLTIAGTLDVSADGSTSGPGGGTQASGGSPSAVAVGGGGAGFGSPGASGATQTTDGGAANAGPAQSDPAQLAVMVGGPRADPASGAGGTGGGGGGGVILVACRGEVRLSGTVDAGGGGGGGGTVTSGMFSVELGAGGGGAGGYIVAQGWSVVVTGSIYANGGGGGGGYTGASNGAPGADGTQSATTPAAGGVAPGGGPGGAGAIKNKGAATGVHTGGGGGGGVGFAQTYTPMDGTATLTPTESSPDFRPNLTVQTK